MLVYTKPTPATELFNSLVAQGLSWARAWTLVQQALIKGQI